MSLTLTLFTIYLLTCISLRICLSTYLSVYLHTYPVPLYLFTYLSYLLSHFHSLFTIYLFTSMFQPKCQSNYLSYIHPLHLYLSPFTLCLAHSALFIYLRVSTYVTAFLSISLSPCIFIYYVFESFTYLSYLSSLTLTLPLQSIYLPVPIFVLTYLSLYPSSCILIYLSFNYPCIVFMF